MGLLDKLRSLFGSGGDDRKPARDTEPDVTVEHEPAAESEHAVKGTGEIEREQTGQQLTAETDTPTGEEDESTQTDDPTSVVEPVSDGDGAESPDAGSAAGEESADDDAPTSAEPDEHVEAPVADAEESADSEPVDDEPTDEPVDSPSVEEIKGIGPTYAERLEAAGIRTVAELSAADPPAVAEAAETGETRAGDWVERAQAF